MVELQILSRVIATGDFSILEDNAITEEYFTRDNGEVGYEKEYRFIKEHYDKYGNVPDKDTFLAKFRDIELPEVTESNKFLVDKIREEYTFRKCVPILRRAADIFNEDANAGVEYMLQALKNVQVNYNLGGTDIISESSTRLEHYKDRLENQDKWFFSTGFHELDNIFHGIQRFEELVVLFARLGQGKSWVLAKIISHIWKLGFRVAYISPEMGPDSVGYRFDTVTFGHSNRGLMWGLNDVDIEQYENDLNSIKNSGHPFIVSTPDDFDNRITISKLRNFIKQHKLDILAIDGVKYLTDERYRRGDSETMSLTHISEDLVKLSVEMQIPIIVVSQANRAGAKDDVPDIENISSSDGIAQCATKVIALRQEDGNLEMRVEKNRYGGVGTKLKYLWNINIGEFIYTENVEERTPEERAERRERKKATGKDIF